MGMALRLIDNPTERLRREFQFELQKRDNAIENLAKQVDSLITKIQQMEMRFNDEG